MTRLLSSMPAFANYLKLTIRRYKVAWPFIKKVAGQATISYVHRDRFQLVYLDRQPDELDTIAHVIGFNNFGMPVTLDGESIEYLYGWPNVLWLAWALRNI